MKNKTFAIIPLLFVAIIVSSCKKEEHNADIYKNQMQQRQDSIFNQIEQSWNFVIPASATEVEQSLSNWKIWNEFVDEITLKPITSITAYQKKIDQIEAKLNSVMYLKYPDEFNTPDIKARVSVLMTSLKNLHMYLRLNPIDSDKVTFYINEVQNDINNLMDQMQTNIKRKSLPQTVLEKNMLQQVLDTIRRANPTNN